MDERAFYRESNTTKPISLNCPFCRTSETYELNWLVRRKKEQLPGRTDERDRARFAKAQSYMVLIDDKVSCKNMRCRKRFDVSGIKTMAFMNPEQEAGMGEQAENSPGQRPVNREAKGQRRPRDAQARAGKRSGNRDRQGNSRQSSRRRRRGHKQHDSPMRGWDSGR